ncbi:volume-regulated anion channel subunit LRRC8A [Nilaparvata lugens]|uniref:volume-regulated anion channel subunit LRRC8A n=1 Tax=Nilaparvata lugens TaxID=108931 RepID=UPI000B983C0A|nr:volume-regulated anion channel subunit LRRC8A [Nilaparvata lugens]
MCVLYYYEYLLMEKLKEGLVLFEKPLASKSEINPNFKSVVDDKCPDKTQNSNKYLTMLIISTNYKECYKISSQLSYQRCKKNFSPRKSIILYHKDDYRLEYKKISSDLWFLDMALEKHPWRLLAFLNSEMNNSGKPPSIAGTSFARYLQLNSIVEVYLDNIGSHDKLVVLPAELFRCKSIKVLSLMNNCLTTLPADIGRMENLEHLVLTDNKLTVKSIPHTLRFCPKLTHLFLDKNHLDALPGMLLDMKQLLVVRRHGNSNYFKSTFIWYHTDVNDRVLKVSNEKCRRNVQTIFQPETLEMLAIQSIIASKENFFRPGFLPEVMQEQISRLYMQFNVCGYCNTAKPKCEQGYKVFTFKYPYLGNTCVPFQHWTCSRQCGEAIEVPARLAQKQAARRLDHEYQQYISSIHRTNSLRPDKSHTCNIL